MKRNAQGKFCSEKKYLLSVGQEECHSPCRRDGFRRLLIEASCMHDYLSFNAVYGLDQILGDLQICHRAHSTKFSPPMISQLIRAPTKQMLSCNKCSPDIMIIVGQIECGLYRQNRHKSFYLTFYFYQSYFKFVVQWRFCYRMNS